MKPKYQRTARGRMPGLVSAGGTLALAVALVLLPGLQAAPMRHVDECSLCLKCHTTDTAPEATAESDKPWDGQPLPTPGSRRLLQHFDLSLSSSVSSLHSKYSEIDSMDGRTGGVGPLGEAGNKEEEEEEEHGPLGRALLQEKKKRKVKVPAYNPDTDPKVPVWFKPKSYMAPDPSARLHLPPCRECWGCRHNLTLLATNTTFLGNTYVNERGATSSWIFKANTNMTASGEAVVKLYCLPLRKRDGGKVPSCKGARIVEIMRLLMALDKLNVDCAFTDLVPRMWLAPVSAVVPDIGYPVNFWGLWMEHVEGISLENFLHKGVPRRLPPKVILELLNDKLNKTRVVRGAIFDLLTSQCDRHSQNIFIQADGNIKLIDNESCLQHMWKNCGFDSILVPTTQKQEIVRLANHYVNKFQGAELIEPSTITMADPQLLLDYRCWIDGQGSDGRSGPAGSLGGAMGLRYPPEVQTCLKKISDMTPQQVMDYYGFPELRVATNLHTRAVDMITKGFEWAAKYGSPQNGEPKRYRLQPSCCRVELNPRGSAYRCAHPWQPSTELPYGNPITGRAWDKDRPDFGKYDGGDFQDSEEFKARGAASGQTGNMGNAVGQAAGGGSAS